MGRERVVTYGEAVRELGTTYAVVAGLVQAHGITPKPVPYCNGKGLDARDMAVLRKALGLRKGESLSQRRREPAPA